MPKIHGQLRDAQTQQRLPGLQVEAFYRLNGEQVILNQTTTSGDNGIFIFEFSEDLFATLSTNEVIKVFFQVYRNGQSLTARGGISALPPSGYQITVTVEVPEESDRAVVKGSVASRTRAGVGGLRVRIVDKSVGEDVVIAEAVTDRTGAYRTAWSADVLQDRGKERPDLQARVYFGETFLGASEVRYNAADAETLHVALADTAAAALESEHETLTAALGSHFSGSLADLKEEDERQDITYLANKSGWDARAVAMAALAEQFSARSTRDQAGAIEPGFFYALFRAGVAANDKAVYQLNAERATAIWKKAIDQGVIPMRLASSLDRAAEHFGQLAAEQPLASPPAFGASSLKEMLSVSLGDDEAAHRKFAQLHVAHGTDRAQFWQAVHDEFGEAKEKRLRIDGQLGQLTLNNAPLIRELHAAFGTNGVTDAVNLVQQGYYREDKWRTLLADDEPPPEIPGDNLEEKRARYADLLAAQIRLSYPTAVLAQMVKSGETPVDADRVDQVQAFLSEHQATFEINRQPIEQYVKRGDVSIASEVVHEITRIQRVQQCTPSNEAMNALLKSNVDSAYAVVRYGQDAFVKVFKDHVGGEANARLIYAKSQEVHNAVLNIVLNYLNARVSPPIGARSRGSIIDPPPGGSDSASADVIAYPTLENLFDEMDYCTCEHCRSVLSPAAYLVDLLHFLDPEDGEWQNTLDEWRRDHGAQYPFENRDAWLDAGSPAAEKALDVLLSRRPDIQHLPLTCENTNTPLPYIDLVNETLEFFVGDETRSLTLEGYRGHNTTGDTTAEELLASPEFAWGEVSVAAYHKLSTTHFPPPLPFDRSLERLRRLCEKFGAPLAEVMETLRQNDELTNRRDYGWRDILLETLRLSREEYRLLTNRRLTLWQLYGYADGTSDEAVRDKLSNVQKFARRVGVTYEDIIEILKTRFINPNSTLIPKLERLGVPFSTLKALKDAAPGSPFDTEFDDSRLPPGLDASQYGGNIKAWIRDDANYARIMNLITVSNPTHEEDLCSFDNLEFRYAEPDDTRNKLRPFEFHRLIRFIRFWKKLGWTIPQTDKAISALYPANSWPNRPDDAVNLRLLERGLEVLLPRLGTLKRVMAKLGLEPDRDLLALLACFSPIDTHGATSFYDRLFRGSAGGAQDSAFAEDGYGNFLADRRPWREKLIAHGETLRGAFSLSKKEFDAIVGSLGFDADTSLNIGDVSAVFRRGWLARRLRLSVRELLLLIQWTGIDPFAAPDPAAPPMERLIDFVSRLRAVSLKPEQALYLVWNQDISGRSAPQEQEILGFGSGIRESLAAIESEYTVSADPDGSITRARMALVYGQDVPDLFFGLLDRTVLSDVNYSHGEPTLKQAIVDAAGGHISYDDLRKRLHYTAGVMLDATRTALKDVADVTQAFKDAVDELHAKSRAFFVQYPELETLHDNYLSSSASDEAKRSALLSGMLPDLKRRHKRQQVLQAISAVTKLDVGTCEALLDSKVAEHYVLHAAGDAGRPALDDFVAMEPAGLAAEFYFSATAGGAVDLRSDSEGQLKYRAGSSRTLPAHPTPGSAISGIWNGLLAAPENGPYNFRIEADADATVGLTLDGSDRPLTQSGTVWRNDGLIELRAGAFYPISLRVDNVKERLVVRWETTERRWQVIPARYLYSSTQADNLQVAYIHLLKAASLATGLKLTAREVGYLATRADHRIDGEGWLNSVPVTGILDSATALSLYQGLETLLGFARLKADLSPEDERLLAVLQDPEGAAGTAESLLSVLTRWSPDTSEALLRRFGKTVADLDDVATFRRAHEGALLLRKFAVSAPALLQVATNAPRPEAVNALQSALRARHDAANWLQVIKPLSDEMRASRRDALVAYILHQFRESADKQHIDTPDKLFDYFLMDVQMDPCMQTSRIRHALSSVQLFIERCLMNLEPRVAASAINARHWQWMKRYRVWEAKSKILLWPENWLEPELRDDQSPIFKETMSELLQSDITDERAAIALGNYLAKLDEVAKLEPCGMYVEEGASGTDDEIVHVVARSAGASRRYFYRRQDSSGWSPWEHIALDIEDNPVIPVVWKGRLFLFWLRILKEAESTTPNVPNVPSGLARLNPAVDIPTEAPKITVKAILCWSEYYNGKWQATNTSSVDLPTLYDTIAPEDFSRSDIRLHAFAAGEALRVYFLDGPIQKSVAVTGTGELKVLSSWPGSFLLFNSHSLPVRGEEPKLQGGLTIELPSLHRRFLLHASNFRIKYTDLTGKSVSLHVLGKTEPRQIVSPLHELDDAWNAPFSYSDSAHVFYVTSHGEPRLSWSESDDYVVATGPELKFIYPLLLGGLPGLPGEPTETPPPTIGGDPGWIDPQRMRRLISEHPYISIGIGMPGGVRYGEGEIGPGGTMPSRPSRPL